MVELQITCDRIWLAFSTKHAGEATVALLLVENGKKPSAEQVFGLSILGYGRNMLMQHGGLKGGENVDSKVQL